MGNDPGFHEMDDNEENPFDEKKNVAATRVTKKAKPNTNNGNSGGTTAPADDARPPAFSDDALAMRFAEEHADDMRHVDDWGKWFIWDGTCWRVDNVRAVFSKSRKICRTAAAQCNKPKVSFALASSKTVAAVVNLVRSDQRIAAVIEQWNIDLWALNTPTGVVDLRTGEMRPHCATDYMTKITAVAPDADCPTPLWQGFLNTVMDGNVDMISFLQRMSGYSLTGSTEEHALFFHHGEGANGKTTLIRTIADILGNYHETAAIETFTASHNEQHPTDLAGLHGARLVTAVETEEGRRWAEKKISALTGGDKIAARFMRQDFFRFVPTFKLVIAGNHKPGLRSVNEAIRRRFNLIPWMVVIAKDKRDHKLLEKLRAEWPGILAWMIEGCLAWQRDGLAPPAIVTEATDAYLEAEDALGAWIEDYCELDANAFELTTTLFAGWKSWAEKSGEYVGTMRHFSQTLDQRGSRFGISYKRDKRSRGFQGLRLTGDAYCRGM